MRGFLDEVMGKIGASARQRIWLEAALRYMERCEHALDPRVTADRAGMFASEILAQWDRATSPAQEGDGHV